LEASGAMIRKIKWQDDPVLGNLELDFTKADGTAYDTIVLGGENGTGKTRVLNTLSTFLNLGTMEPFDFIQYFAAGTPYKITPQSQHGRFVGAHIRENENTGDNETINTGEITNPGAIQSDLEDIRNYGCVYSKARSGFTTTAVKSSTTLQLDSDKYEKDQSADYTSIKQLLVDIDAQDSSELKRLMKNGQITSYEAFQPRAKLSRFENAFNHFFDSLEFQGVDDTNTTEKKIVFKKHGQTISLDDLSTGEKQIVFRGALLLKNSENLDDGIVLIDEPELSMHPQWQQKVLPYYRGLFTRNNTQTVQMLLATHSEYVLRSALEDRDHVLIIVLQNHNGAVQAKRITAPTVLPTLTAAEINYEAFGIISTDYHIALYGYLQTKEHKPAVADCDQYIASHPLYDPVKHAKLDSYRSTTYQTLPTYIRNAIDHPDSGRTYTEEELRTSIELLIKLCT
jgi:AAA15 family ATPase/GTPase